MNTWDLLKTILSIWTLKFPQANVDFTNEANKCDFQSQGKRLQLTLLYMVKII